MEHVRSYDHYINARNLARTLQASLAESACKVIDIKFSSVICGKTRTWPCATRDLYRHVLPLALHSKATIYVEIYATMVWCNRQPCQTRRKVGTLPVMVGSHLLPIPDDQLGGYFVMGGREVVILHYERSASNMLVARDRECIGYAPDTFKRMTVQISHSFNGMIRYLSYGDKKIPLKHVFEKMNVDPEDQMLACGMALLPDEAGFLLNTPAIVNLDEPAVLPEASNDNVVTIGRMAFFCLATSFELMKPQSFDDIVFKRVMTSGERLHQIVQNAFNRLAYQMTHAEAGADRRTVITTEWQDLLSTGTYYDTTHVKPHQTLRQRGKMQGTKYVGLMVPLVRINDLASRSILSKCINATSQSDASSRVFEPRMLGPRDFGRFCPFDTPDSQDKMGILKTLTTSSVVTLPAIEARALIEGILRRSCGVEANRPIAYTDLFATSKLKCYIDGAFIGAMRASLEPSVRAEIGATDAEDASNVSIVTWTPIAAKGYKELHVWTDAGRVMRKVRGRYMDAFEEEQLWASATTRDELESLNETDGPSSIVGPCMASFPFWRYNQAPRNVYATAQMKQAIGAEADANACFKRPYTLAYPQRALVRVEGVESNVGFNAIVAVISEFGNQEDALIMSSKLRDFGGFRSFMHLTTQELGPSSFEPGQRIPAGETIVAQNPKTLKFGSQKTKLDGVVESVAMCDTQTNVSNLGTQVDLGITSTTRIRCFLPPQVGDKFSSRSGQKGTVSCFRSAEDLPWTMDGMTPDIIFNPHGMPSRLVPGHLKEGMEGIEAALKDSDTMRYAGKQVMFSGTTGEELECQVYVGIIYYMRLCHLADVKMYAKADPPTDLTTLQPKHGRSVEGAQKMGHMERGVLKAYGATSIIEERSPPPVTVGVDADGNIDVPARDAVRTTRLPGITTRVIHDLQALNVNCQLRTT